MKAYSELTETEKARLAKFAEEVFGEIQTDEFLRMHGYDPEEVGKKMMQVAKDALSAAKEPGTLHDQCSALADFLANAIEVLQRVTGQAPEAQEDNVKPLGSLTVIEHQLRDLQWAAHRVLTLATEVQRRILEEPSGD